MNFRQKSILKRSVKDFNIEKFIDLFKYENKQLNQIIRFFDKYFENVYLMFCF